MELGPTLSREGLSEKMRKASFLVLPSAYESFGLVIAEALASGTPVIVPDRTAPPEILFEGAGISVDPMDEEALAKAMKRMIEKGAEKSPEELHRRIEERYGMERVGRTWSELYQKALGDP